VKIFRGVFLVCIIGGFAALFSVLSPSRGLMEGPEEGVEFETEEDILVEGLRYSEWAEGKLLWSMDSKRARYRHKEKKAGFEEVEVTFFPSTGGKLLLWARVVDYDLQTRNLVARESVRGKSDQGYDFVTESILYDADRREVTTEDKVTLGKDRLTIRGVGMKGSLVDHKFRLLSEVSAVFAPQGTLP
jgi:LPS export ABC transporter protein LptC